MDEDGLNPRMTLHSPRERGDFRKIGTRPDDIKDFQALTHTLVESDGENGITVPLILWFPASPIRNPSQNRIPAASQPLVVSASTYKIRIGNDAASVLSRQGERFINECEQFFTQCQVEAGDSWFANRATPDSPRSNSLAKVAAHAAAPAIHAEKPKTRPRIGTKKPVRSIDAAITARQIARASETD
jgi:hypothetical protein